jgi:hypothetical protein
MAVRFLSALHLEKSRLRPFAAASIHARPSATQDSARTDTSCRKPLRVEGQTGPACHIVWRGTGLRSRKSSFSARCASVFTKEVRK